MAESKQLSIKRCEHAKLVASAQIQAREIRIMELDDEAGRCRQDMEVQRKIIADMDEQIKKLNG